ncbi:hypothetical protein J3R83DRAFT_5616 [Lanmaoa asiatica]|nr:hypothetical protein J3R83DRAFT_5616 [Lanmaoa asiatica]
MTHHHEHKPKLSHELIAGAVAYEAMKVHHHHQEQAGHHVSHAKTKEIMAGVGGALADRIIEPRVLDALDRSKAKHNGE